MSSIISEDDSGLGLNGQQGLAVGSKAHMEKGGRDPLSVSQNLSHQLLYVAFRERGYFPFPNFIQLKINPRIQKSRI